MLTSMFSLRAFHLKRSSEREINMVVANTHFLLIFSSASNIDP